MERISLLIIGKINNFYIENILEKLSEEKISIDVLDIIAGKFQNSEEEKIETLLSSDSFLSKLPIIGKLKKLLAVMKFLKKRKKKYDILSIHYIDPIYGMFFKKKFYRISDTIISSVWGSDFHSTSNFIKKYIQKRIYQISDTITFNNQLLLDEFSSFYKRKFDSKLKLVRFGLTNLEFIKDLKSKDINKLKKELNIPSDSFIIACGHNGRETHQHKAIINSLLRIKNQLPKNIFLLIPMTYGGTLEYINSIEHTVKQSGFKYKILTKRMDANEIASLRIITDIMIHVQLNDSFSAAMQEHFFAGSVVINGAWLPYSFIKKQGVFFIEADKIDNLSQIILETIQKIENYKKRSIINKEIIWKMSSWDSNIQEWKKLYHLN